MVARATEIRTKTSPAGEQAASSSTSRRTSAESRTSNGNGQAGEVAGDPVGVAADDDDGAGGIGRLGLDDADRRGDLAGRDGRRHREADAGLQLVGPHGDALGDEGGGVGRRRARRCGSRSRPAGRRGRCGTSASRRGRGRRRRGTTGCAARPAGAARRGGGRRGRRRCGSRSAGGTWRRQAWASAMRIVDVGRLLVRRPVGRPGRCARSPRRACRRARAARSASPGRAWSSPPRRPRRASDRRSATARAAPTDTATASSSSSSSGGSRPPAPRA